MMVMGNVRNSCPRYMGTCPCSCKPLKMFAVEVMTKNCIAIANFLCMLAD